jgi:WD40 repeat protein
MLTHIVPPWIENRLWSFSVTDGVLRQFDTNTGDELRSVKRDELSQMRSFISISWDGRLAATSGRDGIVRLFETETGRDLGTVGAHGVAVRSAAFAPGNETLATADAQGKVILWDLTQRTPRAVLRGHSGPVWPIAFSHDGQQLCTSCTDHKVRIWDISQPPPATDVCPPGHRSMVACVAFSPDGRVVASGGTEPGGGLIKLWDVATGQFIRQFEGHRSWVWSLSFSPDGKELASTGVDGTIKLWDLNEREPRFTIDTGSGFRKNGVSWLTYSRDGRELITSEDGGTLRVWDRATGKQIRSVKVGQSNAWQPALSPDGRYLVAGVDESMVMLEYPSLKTIRRFPPSPLFFNSALAISPDGQTLASWDGKQVFLSTLDGALLGTMDHAADVWVVDFSPNGHTLVTGDMNDEVHIWDVDRFQERATLRGHNAQLGMVRFSPDGKTIASVGTDGTVRLWRSDPSD